MFILYLYMAVGPNQWYHFGGPGAPPTLEPILVVGLNRMFTGGTYGIEISTFPRSGSDEEVFP